MSDSGSHRPQDVSQTNAQASCLGAKPDGGPGKVRKKKAGERLHSRLFQVHGTHRITSVGEPVDRRQGT